MDLETSVRAVENRLINEGAGGTGLSAPRLAVHVARLLHQWSPDGVNVLRPAQRLIEDISVPDREMHEVRFRMRLPIASMTRTPAPMLEGVEVEDGVTVAMSCAMPGAQILYSLDENFPATPYTEPVLITEPAVVSAVAIAPGLIVSRVSTAKISPT